MRSETGPGRREFLKYSGGAVAAGGLASAGIGASLLAPTPAAAAAANPAAASPAEANAAAVANAGGGGTPIRPPAAPAAVRGPYLSTWVPATVLPGTWPQFWQGHVTAMTGIVRVDGTAYAFLGDPAIPLTVPNGNYGTATTIQDFPHALTQTGLTVTPTRSVFELSGGGVGVTVEFLSPVEPGDLTRQSIPLSYVTFTVRATDGKQHDVQVYADVTGEWCSGDPAQEITWAPQQVPVPAGTTKAAGPGGAARTLQVWTVQLADQQPLTEQNQQAAWGSLVWAAPQGTGVTYQSGQDIVVRSQFVNNGMLTDTNDMNYRAIQDDWPVFGFATDLGGVGAAAATIPLTVGWVRTPAVSYQGQDLQPLWTAYYATWQDMLAEFHADRGAAAKRADRLDTTITEAAASVGGQHYAGLTAIALRQAYGGTELVVGPDGKQPWAFMKEISSDGNVSTVDVMFPASPAWIYADPAYLALLLEPLLSYAESGNWPEQFAPHDLGSAYPVADGHNDGGGENMPMEESGNMLIMAAAYIQAASARTAGVDPADATSFVAAHYAILKQWADYLVANLPDPGYQNQTDDFAGSIAHSVNLALKGIIGVAAMAKIAQVAGNTADASSYKASAARFIAYWTAHSQDPSAKHLDLTYNGDDGGDGTWGTTYNGFADALLGTGLVAEATRAEQAAWYASQLNEFGLPLQVPHSYAKSDWQLFTAAWLTGYPVSQQLIDAVYAYANTTPNRVPFSDLYSTVSGDQSGGFQARPVQGGMFAPLALKTSKAR
jgi:hypothetical protein